MGIKQKSGKKLNAVNAILHFGSCLETYWVNSDKINKMYFVQKNSRNSMKAVFSSLRDLSGGFECVLVQTLLIQTLFSVLFDIRRKVILSSIR